MLSMLLFTVTASHLRILLPQWIKTQLNTSDIFTNQFFGNINYLCVFYFGLSLIGDGDIRSNQVWKIRQNRHTTSLILWFDLRFEELEPMHTDQDVSEVVHLEKVTKICVQPKASEINQIHSSLHPCFSYNAFV